MNKKKSLLEIGEAVHRHCEDRAKREKGMTTWKKLYYGGWIFLSLLWLHEAITNRYAWEDHHALMIGTFVAFIVATLGIIIEEVAVKKIKKG